MAKADLKKEYKDLYAPSAKGFEVVEVPPLQYLMVDGRGDPNTARAYSEAVEMLYATAYALKFMCKKQADADFTVMPLEGLWWAEEMENFAQLTKAEWLWTMMILQPDAITPAMVDVASQQVAAKKGLPAPERVRLERYEEGRAAQILYYGAYADEGPTIARLHEFIAEQGYALRGKHHEIYLGDPRRTAAATLKTVIRQPIG